MNKFLMILGLMLMTFTPCNAALIEDGTSVAVMDLGVHKGTSDPDINLLNAEGSASEYIIQRLFETKHFDVKDRTLVLDTLQKFNMAGSIDPDTAKKIGEILGVKYIVYGNVIDVVVDVDKSLVTVNTVKAHLVIRIMEVDTGKIIMAARGTGESESGFIGDSTEKFITIGTVKVSEISIHNALQKAAFQATDILVERLFGSEKSKRKKK